MEITTSNFEFSPKEIQVLNQAGIIPNGAPSAQIALFAQVCKSRNLSPFNKEIYLVGYGGNYSIIVGIDGFRAIANRTGLLCGMDEPQFDKKGNGVFKTIADFGANEKPLSCTVTVYKMVGGVRCPFTHTASFKEFSSGKQKWASMPFQMIAKIAEAFALRKAFGGEFEGIRSEDELAAIEGDLSTYEIVLPEPTEKILQGLKKRAQGDPEKNIDPTSYDDLMEKVMKHYSVTEEQIATIKSWYK